jgi:hypothetical protein
MKLFTYKSLDLLLEEIWKDVKDFASLDPRLFYFIDLFNRLFSIWIVLFGKHFFLKFNEFVLKTLRKFCFVSSNQLKDLAKINQFFESQ